MRIRITAVDYQEEHIIVSCDLGIGMLKGIWKGKDLPILNSDYDVEFTLKDMNSEQVKILTGTQENILVKIKDNNIFFTGICENYDEEIYDIRFADDWLQMISMKENCQSIHVDDKILFWMHYHQITIYPYDIF